MRPDRNMLIGGVGAAVVITGLAGFGIARLTAKPDAPPEKAEADTAPANIKIAPTVLQGSGVVVEAVHPGGFAAEVIAPATVTAAPGGEALVTARAAGAIARIDVRLGDEVGVGRVLAIVESREAAQIAADRVAAEARAALAQKTLARERSLFEQRVSPRVDYEQAQAQAQLAAAEVRRAEVAASAAKVTRDGRGVLVVSPIAGRVTAMSASLGNYVQPEAELFRVANPSRVQIEAALPAAEAVRVKPGDRAHVDLPDGRSLEISVRSVTPSLSAESRTATAVLDAPGLQLTPGQTGRARIFLRDVAPATGVIVVPEEAVQTVNGRDVVFVRTAAGFNVRPVIRGRASAGRIEILSGLSAGQQIATRNAFLLKAELGKGEGEEE